MLLYREIEESQINRIPLRSCFIFFPNKCAGKTNRVVGYQNGRFMDMDIDEGLAMTKDIDEYQLQIAHLLGK